MGVSRIRPVTMDMHINAWTLQGQLFRQWLEAMFITQKAG
ncbi:hypothetical protein DSBG_3000 [Desulfosporosinus sp. BG]|nr:hypothetical protein DSBG_3000 [Desulfosporosinus sp. BG]